MSTPAEQYALARERAAFAATPAGRFAQSLDFELDPFQLAGIQAVQDGSGVLVAAPTGAGKTVVGEFAVALALETGRKAFYTTPIKALSNQKYHDLVDRYGVSRVGLLTGDASINGEAPIVVMTTEVLRNMMYAASRTLTGLGFVVMDEVHYLADRWRGAVWEEVIIHLPASVQVISLSATVSNAEEFGDWLSTVRGNTEVIVSEHRPVPLWQHMLVGTQLFDLFVSDGQGPGTARVNPEMLQKISQAERSSVGHWSREDAGGPRGRRGQPRGGSRDSGGGRQGGGHGRGGQGGRGGARDERGRQGQRGQHDQRSDRGRAYGDAVPALERGALPGGVASRAQVIEQLDRGGLLPAITFIFSRAGCDAAVGQLLGRNTRLVTEAEGAAIRELVQTRVADVDLTDLAVLGYHDFVEGLARGYAAHHAGMLPLFREVVEELFTAGRVKAVFATETLALGINMPARTVVLEKLVKFNGEAHVQVTPAEYTQLTGRAGRRGIDIEGHAVVLWRRGVDPMDVAGLASTRTYQLRSSFRPSSNMAVNLVAQYGRERARELLQSSFAQFQADRSVVGLTTTVRDNVAGLAGYAEAMQCHLGDFGEYGKMRHELATLEKKQAKRRQSYRREAIAQSLEELTPGQVIQLDGGRKGTMAVVLRGQRGPAASPEPTVLTSNGSLQKLGVAGLKDAPEVIGALRIPPHFNPRSPKARKDLASALRDTVREPLPPALRKRQGGADAGGDDVAVLAGTSYLDEREQRVDDVRALLRAHPCHGCPDREEHARWAARWWQLLKETDDLQRRVSERTNTVAKTFERICDLLSGMGYLTEDGQQVTDAGERLRRIYTELDLVVAEALRRGTWKRLTPADLAAVVSTLIYEARGDDVGEDRMPSVEVAEALGEMGASWREIMTLKSEHGLDGDRELDAGIAWVVHRWTSGRQLEEILRDGDLAAGDFVRRCKQIVDLLGQIARAAEPELAKTARRASDAILRGVVAADRLD
ncbi:MAG: DEAD/DEAH box helicase [Ornithinimicrobium sp.]|uniref:DEAD/DEAH box helicase n=1 Tax=Ornithinimicrobium sp. TaxID=1977084 RepID=UPI0026DEF815|nr:DEAD/DEAH box helicase [Ornithinimicrobium sp.]MDO5738569.1 DEAD/DEAH box helicase [Ornithinimicrobium sp.]